MVTIIDYRVNLNSEGKPFCSLILQGGIELVQSKESGNFYATARKTSITSTFDEATCKQLKGTTLKGSIVKLESEEYEYVVPDTGEVMMLHHKYVYVPEAKNVEEEVFA